MKYQLLVVLSLCLAAFSQVSQEHVKIYFDNFAKEHNKVYTSQEEYNKRFQIFQDNLKIIEYLNQNEKGTAEYGINQFADMSVEEFKEKILMPPAVPPKFPQDRYMKPSNLSLQDLPDSFDWRDKGAVTPVKNQGTVGTCWVFSTTGNIEGQWFLAKNELVTVAEEQIVDCDGSQDVKNTKADCGVFGGWPYLAMQYVIKAGGLPKETDYPYCVGDGSCFPCQADGYNETLCGPPVEYCNATQYPCKEGKVDIAVKIDDWKAISTDETEIQKALVETGPFSVALDAQNLQFYRKGIFDPSFCSKTELDHAVLMVGYGVQPKTALKKEKPYWLIKNSWGEKWGESGYFRIMRGEGTCGINTQVITAVVNKQSESKEFLKIE